MFLFKLNKRKVSLTHNQLKYHLHYNPETGIFTWIRPRAACVKPGAIAGNIDISVKSGSYVGIKIFGIKYKAHRLAWFYMTGEWPQHDIDHKDTDGLNNKWSNLRKASAVQNAYNRKKSTKNTSGYKGVSFCKTRRKYRATITVNKKWKLLGYFEEILDAHLAYKNASMSYHREYART